MKNTADREVVEKVERLAEIIENDEELLAECLGTVMDALDLPYHEDPDDFTDEEDDHIQTLFARVLHRLASMETSAGTEFDTQQVRARFYKLVNEELPNVVGGGA